MKRVNSHVAMMIIVIAMLVVVLLLSGCQASGEVAPQTVTETGTENADYQRGYSKALADVTELVAPIPLMVMLNAKLNCERKLGVECGLHGGYGPKERIKVIVQDTKPKVSY